jgi:hypothetical protein
MTHDVQLTPDAHRAAGLATDDIVEAMMGVEVAWMRALAQGGAGTAGHVDAVAAAASSCRDGLGSSRYDAHPASYLGSIEALVDEVLTQPAARKASDG